MRAILSFAVSLTICVAVVHAQQPDIDHKDASAHSVSFVEVQKGVKLEVLDWGGTGCPMVLIPGNGFTAHEFDSFAPKLTARNHVYGITRRGFGASSAPAPDAKNYSADRLGDDVLAVIEALHLERPVLVGHSLGGEELSSVASRHPEKVAGLIYLDAAYSYAYYDPNLGDVLLDSIDLRNKLNSFLEAKNPDANAALAEIQADLPRYENDVRRQREQFAAFPPHPTSTSAPDPIQIAISNGKQKYTKINVPALAIFADPHGEVTHLFPDDAKKREIVIAPIKPVQPRRRMRSRQVCLRPALFFCQTRAIWSFNPTKRTCFER